MENNFASNLKHLRLQSGMTQEELAKKLDKDYSTIGKWELGQRSPIMTDVIRIAELFNISLEKLIGQSIIYDNAEPIELGSNTIKIPVLGKIPAGMPLEAIENTYTVDTIDISAEWLKGDNHYFALKLEGDSMEPDYLDKDIVIFKQTSDCESGQDCCIRINGFDATFKRVRKQENGIMIIPLNENNSTGFVSTFYSKEDIENMPIEILGIVKQIRRNKN